MDTKWRNFRITAVFDRFSLTYSLLFSSSSSLLWAWHITKYQSTATSWRSYNRQLFQLNYKKKTGYILALVPHTCAPMEERVCSPFAKMFLMINSHSFLCHFIDLNGPFDITLVDFAFLFSFYLIKRILFDVPSFRRCIRGHAFKWKMHERRWQSEFNLSVELFFSFICGINFRGKVTVWIINWSNYRIW